MTSVLETNQLGVGTWVIDPVHSSIGFSVRHLMVSKVRGRFEVISGTVTIADDTALSAVDATIDAASVNSGDAKRDEHLRADDFFGVAEFPTVTFRSTAVDGSVTVASARRAR